MPYVSHGPSHDMPYTVATVSATAQTVTVVTGVTSQVIRVYALFLVTGTATTVTFQDSVGVFSGGLTLGATAIFTLPNAGTPWFTTAPGASFQIINSASTLAGTVYYTIDKYYG